MSPDPSGALREYCRDCSFICGSSWTAEQHRYPALAPDRRRQRNLMLGGLARQVGTLARRQPVLMMFEDADWADETKKWFSVHRNSSKRWARSIGSRRRGLHWTSLRENPK